MKTSFRLILPAQSCGARWGIRDFRPGFSPSFSRLCRDCLLLTVLLWPLTVQSAFSEMPSKTKPAPAGEEFISFLSYELKASHFQESFSGIIRQIAAGQGKKNHASLERALLEIRNRKPFESRGRVDVLHFLEGYALEKLGRTKEAASAYGLAVGLRSQNPLYTFRHALMLKRIGKCEKAANEFQQVAWQVKQASYEPMFLAGECAETLGKPEEAKRLYQEAARRNPMFPPVLKKLVVQYREELSKTFEPGPRNELEGRIRSSLEHIVRQDPLDRDSALELAELYLGLRQTIGVNTLLNKASELSRTFVLKSSYKDDRALHLLILAESRLGRKHEADRLLKKGLQANPNSQILAGLAPSVPGNPASGS